jgi:hypothetical protein
LSTGVLKPADVSLLLHNSFAVIPSPPFSNFIAFIPRPCPL